MKLNTSQIETTPVCVVMVKAPRAGEVKTRLAPVLSATDAASLAACFAQDAVAKALEVTSNCLIAYAPSDGRELLASLLPDNLLWTEQRGSDLGARLEASVTCAAAKGFAPVVVTGTDSPTLPASFIREAVEVLARDDADIALGPTEDGGYYLVGLRVPVQGLFSSIAWSTPLAYEQTARNAARVNLRLHRLPLWYDVDEPDDLIKLERELLNSRAEVNAEARLRAPATYRWLRARRAVQRQGAPL